MKYKKYNRFRYNIWTAPLIYSCIIPLALIDLWITIYQKICFRVYKIPVVTRSHYIRIDRHKLSYLTWHEKLHCAYCGYGNGVAAYLVKVIADTEDYWCSIKHKKTDKKFIEPHHHKKFVEYGDKKAYEKLSK